MISASMRRLAIRTSRLIRIVGNRHPAPRIRPAGCRQKRTRGRRVGIRTCLCGRRSRPSRAGPRGIIRSVRESLKALPSGSMSPRKPRSVPAATAGRGYGRKLLPRALGPLWLRTRCRFLVQGERRPHGTGRFSVDLAVPWAREAHSALPDVEREAARPSRYPKLATFRNVRAVWHASVMERWQAAFPRAGRAAR